jgi:DNA-binding ferritin-like protein
LDELVDSWRELSDTVAASGIDPVDGGALDTDTATRDLVERLADVSERIRARMDRLGEIDLASQDVLAEVVRELEKQLWMPRVSLPA